MGAARQDSEHALRVLHVTTSWPTDAAPGAGSFVAKLVDAERALGIAVEVVHPRTSGSVLAAIRAPLRWFGLSRTLRRMRRDVRARLAQHPDTIVHAHWWPCAWLARRAGAKRIVVTLHGSDVALLGLPVVGGIGRRTIARCDAVCAVSHALARDVAECTGIEEQRIHVVTHGDDVTDTGPDPRERVSIAYAGPLEPHKGADLLPAIVRALRTRGCPARINVAGTGSLASSLAIELAGEIEHGTVTLLGQLPHDDILELVAHAAVTICPSRFEGYGLVCQEARHRGAAVAAFHTGGLVEQLDGLPTGRLVAMGDVDALADAAVELLDDVDGRVAAWRSLATVPPRSWRDCAQEYVALISSVRKGS